MSLFTTLATLLIPSVLSDDVPAAPILDFSHFASFLPFFLWLTIVKQGRFSSQPPSSRQNHETHSLHILKLSKFCTAAIFAPRIASFQRPSGAEFRQRGLLLLSSPIPLNIGKKRGGGLKMVPYINSHLLLSTFLLGQISRRCTPPQTIEILHSVLSTSCDTCRRIVWHLPSAKNFSAPNFLFQLCFFSTCGGRLSS